ncbi:MAG: SpaA isopeptide-forming pilin-related protein [Lachnospiraceae bacterium]|nr:SpaA isopeptide-forming pilin-related protein [Lachnospiraceae bacterium]
MDSSLLERARTFLRAHHKKNIWYRTMCGLAAVVVFVTTYMLILPAITMERETICGLEEHVHSDECYEMRAIDQSEVLKCTKGTLKIHEHTDSCYDLDHNLICGYADYVIHTHDEKCYDADGNLVCTLPEVKEHEHTASCYKEEKKLICGQEESAGHQHSEDCCKKEKGSLTCEKVEHVHGTDCYDEENNLICGQEEHVHGNDCYQWNQVLVCTQEESEGHTHTDACYESVKTLTCDKQEVIPHTHTDSCYDESGKLVCGKIEVKKHQHTEECFKADGEPETEKVLICEKEEHEHGDTCYAEETESEGEKESTESSEAEAGNDETGEDDTANVPVVLAEGDEDNGESTSGNTETSAAEQSSENGNAEEKKLTITSISGSGTKYDPDKDCYSSDLRIEFELTKNDISTESTYYYTYPEGITIPDGLLDQEKDLYDKSGTKAGTYIFVKNADGTYSVKIKFDDSYVSYAGDTITGYVQFNGKIDADKVNENGNIVIVGEDGVSLTIQSEDIEYPENETNLYDIDVSKSGSYVVDGDKLVYTVYIRSYKGTPDPINFTDTLKAEGLTLGDPVVTVEKGSRYYSSENSYYDGSEFETVSVNPTYDNGTITMSLGGITPGKVTQNDQVLTKVDFYKITYTYDISDMTATEISPENTVTVSAKDTIKNQTVTDEETCTVKINKNHSMNKSGWYDSAQGKIKWTITVNENGADITGAELTDSMLEKLSDHSDITFSPDGGYEVITDNGSIIGIRFKAIGDTGVNTNKYIITYYTDVESTWEDQKISNKAVFDPTPNDGSSGDEITGNAEVSVGGGSVAKSMDGAVVAEDGKTAEVTWTVTLTVPESGLPEGTTIEDDVTKNQWGNSNTYSQWMTRTQVTAWACNLYWFNGNSETTGGTNTYQVPGSSVTFLASDGQKYTYQEISENRDGVFERLTYTVFTIVLDDGLKPPEGFTQLYFTYSTTVDLDSAAIGSNSYYNSVKVGDKSAGAEYVYHKAGVKKTDGNNQTGTTSVSSDGTVTWKIVANMDDQNHTKLTLQDTLPEQVTLSSLNLAGWGNLNMDLLIGEDGIISGTDTTNQYHVSGTYSNNTVTLNITPMSEGGVIQNNSEFTLTVTGYVNGAENQTDTLALTNKADMILDENTEVGSSEQTQNWTYNTTSEEKKVVDKSGSWDNDNRRMNYSIILNPEGKDLVEGTEVLTVIDELTYYPAATVYNPSPQHDVTVSVTLVQGSVKLYKAVQSESGNWTKGEEVKDWSWTYSSQKAQYTDNIVNTLTGTDVPDRTPLILEYTYVINSSAAEGDQFSFGVSNTAKLEGTSYSDYQDNSQTQWKEQDSSAGVTTEKKFILYKVEEGNYNNVLSGAVFSVYAYDTSTGNYEGTAQKTYTTDQNGMLQIQWKDGGFSYNTLYKLVETTPPTGYKLPDTVNEFYFYFSSETDTSKSLPDSLPSSAVDLSNTSYTVYAENVKNSTEITVEKKWKDKDGNEIVHNNGSVTINLYQKSSQGSNSGGGDSSGTGVTYKYTSNGSVTVESGTRSDIQVGSVVEITVTMSYDCTYWQPDVTLTGMKGIDGGSWSHSSNSIYTRQAEITDQSIVVDVGDSKEFSVSIKKISTTESTDSNSDESESSSDTPAVIEGTLYKTVTFSKDNDWTYTFTNLPLTGTGDDGSTVNYYYYVQEVSVPNFTTGYDNNNGIQSGTITVTNKATENPEYELPETGGPGTHTAYTLGSILMLLASAAFLYIKKRKDGEKGGLK